MDYLKDLREPKMVLSLILVSLGAILNIFKECQGLVLAFDVNNAINLPRTCVPGQMLSILL